MTFYQIHCKYFGIICIYLVFYSLGLASEQQQKEKKTKFSKIVDASKIAYQVLNRLNNELKAYGINTKDLWRNRENMRVPVPKHKRSRIILFTQKQEQIISEKEIQSMLENGDFYHNEDEEKNIRNIAQKIREVLPEKISIRIFLLRDDSVNACCLPDGTVLVTRGMLTQIKDPQQRAAIIAHEYGHAVARHPAERMTKVILKKTGETAFVEVSKKNKTIQEYVPGDILKSVYGYCSETGFILPYSRTMEYEADKLGIIFLKKAGLDPWSIIRVLDFMDKTEQKNISVFAKYRMTHPVSRDRIEKAKLVIIQTRCFDPKSKKQNNKQKSQ